ncbi:hypothetical protein BC941DRAFT_445397 [Chlamydoabsidia padenii]|nr:hypothetical protein BC941DRAFT_445397 [Chlamydoabsidia padenii]
MIIPILIKPQIVQPNLLHLFPESLPLVVMKMMMLLLRLMMSLKVMKVIPISILVSVLLLKVLLLLEMLLLMMFLLSESDTVLDRLYRGDTKQQRLNHKVYMRDAMERIRRHRQRIVEERRIQEEDNLHLVEMSYNRMLPEGQTTIFITTTNRNLQSQHPPHWLKNYG